MCCVYDMCEMSHSNDKHNFNQELITNDIQESKKGFFKVKHKGDNHVICEIVSSGW